MMKINETSISDAVLNLTKFLKPGQHDYPTEHINSLDLKDYILVVIFIIIFLVGVAGNTLVCYIFLRRNPSRLSTMELLIVFLAIADLVSSIFNPMMFIYWTVTFHKAWHFGEFGCKVLPSLTRITVTVSFGIILIITIDRCVVICFPFRRNMKRNEVYLSVLSALVFAIISELSYAIHIEVNPVTTCQVPDSRIPGYVYPFLTFLIFRDVAFLFIFSSTISLIYLSLYDKEHVSVIREQRVVKKAKKIMIMLITMSVIFIFLVYPRDIFLILFNITWLNPPGIPYTKTSLDINSFLKVLHVSNSICNVFIYARLHGKFRRRMIRLVKTVIGKTDVSEQNHYFTNTMTEARTVMSLSFVQKNTFCHELANARLQRSREDTFVDWRTEVSDKNRFALTRLNKERKIQRYRRLSKDFEYHLNSSRETVL